LTATHYAILMLVVCSAYWVFISLVDMVDSKKRLNAKKKTWGKLKKVSDKIKVEKGMKVWRSLGESDHKKEDIK
jgi:hypothetical protein